MGKKPHLPAQTLSKQDILRLSLVLHLDNDRKIPVSLDEFVKRMLDLSDGQVSADDVKSLGRLIYDFPAKPVLFSRNSVSHDRVPAME